MAKRKKKARRAARDNSEETRIPADTSQHASNNSYSPKLFYEDTPFTCVDCGKTQIWTATQQKWWYEVAKGTIYSRANRCRECRQAKRESANRGLFRDVTDAK